jgi:DNA replication protein DnaC
MTTEIKERIVKYSKELRLPTFRGEFEVHASEAAKQEASYEEYLLGLMEKEYYTRVENRKKSQIRQAGFPQKHYLHDLQKELLPDNARQKLPLLERLDFIKEGRNVVLAGNPGTGKTHIATGLGIKACQHNYKVLFTTVELFGDPVLTSALVDRLTHKAYIINMNGESFRLRETKALMKK